MAADQQPAQPVGRIFDDDASAQQQEPFECELVQQQQQPPSQMIEKDAPSPENWYHGRLDRIRSEERLRLSNKPGAFLVRESDRKPGSFVLCYLSYKFSIFHFKITAVFGDYYIGGRQFDRLETLISYYMYYSELVKGEKLIHPIAPPVMCHLERVCISIKAYPLKPASDPDLSTSSGALELANSSSNSEDILYFDSVGQLFRVFHQVGEGEWLWAQSFETNDCGLVYSKCVEFIEDHRLHEIEPWYYPNISKDEAAIILANAGLFSYLVRPSEQSPGDFTLFFNINNLVHRYRIAGLIDNETGSKYYSIGGRQFSSISLIVGRYMNEDITEGFRLTKKPHAHDEAYPSTSLFQIAQQSRINSQLSKSLVGNGGSGGGGGGGSDALSVRRNVFSKKKSFSFSTESASQGYLASASSASAKAQMYHPSKRNSITTTGLNESEMSELEETAQRRLYLEDEADAGAEVNCTGYYSKLADIVQSPVDSPPLMSARQAAHATEAALRATTLTQSANSAFTSINHGAPPSAPSSVLDSLVSSLAPAAKAKTASATPSEKKAAASDAAVAASKFSQSMKASKKIQLSVSKSLSSPISSIVSGSRTNDFLNLSSRAAKNSAVQSSSTSSSSRSKQTNLKMVGAADMLKRHSDKIALKGFLSKYSDKTKKWKIYYFILNQTDQQLFYFTEDKRMKEKGMIDLSYGLFYPVDDSFFNRPFCFEVVIHSLGNSGAGASAVHYLCAESYQSFKEWTENIRPLCNPVQYNPFVSTHSASLSNSSSLSLSSSSGTSSSSSPHQTIVSHEPTGAADRSLRALVGLNQSQGELASSSSSSQNYRILRTLNIEIHEARNVCFAPLVQISSTAASKETVVNGLLGSTTNGGASQQQSFAAPPKFHKENLYYCLVMFNNEAFVASTRSSTCNSNTVSISALSNGLQAGSASLASMLSSEIASLSSNGSLTSKDAIWDDSFAFDNLPLDVRELKICLFVQAKRSNLSAQLVNNLKKMSGSTTSKFLDPLLIGYVNVRLDELMNRGLVEQWYHVEPTVNVDSVSSSSSSSDAAAAANSASDAAGSAPLINLSNACTMRVKIRFCEEKIQLSPGHYKPLSDYLLDENEHKHICTLYEQIMPSSERSHLVHALLRFYIVKHRLVDMLKSYLVTEIDRCSDLSTIFRPATLCTSLMDNYMRTRCDDFLVKSLQEPLTRILRWDFAAASSSSSSSNGSHTNGGFSSSGVSFELDPSKCPDAQQREQNLVNFQAALKELISSICSVRSTSLFPQELKYLFHLIRQQVHLKWQQQQSERHIVQADAEAQSTSPSVVVVGQQDDRQIRIYCVSAFVFLRLLCPAMLNPKSFGLKFFPTANPSPNKVNLSSTLNGLILESSSLMAATAATSTTTTTTTAAADQPTNDLPHSVGVGAKHSINYPKLATQFAVFSPAFMFSLTPQHAGLGASFSVSSSSYVVQQADSGPLGHHPLVAAAAATATAGQSLNVNQLSSLATTLSSASSGSSSTASSSFFSYGSSSGSGSGGSSSSSSPPNPSTYERHIKLLAKVLQTLANMTECKEPFMLPLSSFLSANKPSVVKFIEDVSNVSEFTDAHPPGLYAVESGAADDINVQFEHATCKYLAILHRLLSSFVPAMRTYLAKSTSDSNGAESDAGLAASLQRLVAILDDISARKP